MKKSQMILVAALTITLLSCGNGTADNTTKKDSGSTATDTITNVTNPGVGTASDDTSARP